MHSSDAPGSGPDPDRASRSSWWRRWDPLAVLTLVALAGYAVVGIGSPLLGITVFAATDLLTEVSPYRDAGLAGTPVQNTYLNDTVDVYLPNTALFVSALHQGEFAAWNPYIIGGTPLGASLNLGLLNPVALPYLLLPAWLAPGYVKLLEIVVAAGGTFLFLRRLGLQRPAALLGGLVFASSGFMVAWTNWPHTRVAALVPALFWALERLVQRRRAGDAVLVSVVTAALVLGGFPAVAGYGLLFGGCYLMVRVLAAYRGQWRTALGVALGSAAAVLAGLLLTAVQVVPFLSYMSAAQVNGREQSPDDHLLPETLVTIVAPWAMGSTDPGRPPQWYLYVNLVESLVYLGAAALVLVVTAVAMPRAGRAVTREGVWSYFVASALALLVVLYAGRLPLAVLQQLPVLFSENFVGRARSVLGFLLAVLAAIGFQVLLNRAPPVRVRPYPVAVWTAAALVGLAAWWDARRAARAAGDPDPAAVAERVGHLDRHVLLAVALTALAVLLVMMLRWSHGDNRSRVRAVAAALLPLLVAGQALSLAVPYWPRVDRDTFYPVTDTHQFLADNLGHDRFAGSGGGMYVGADSAHRLRALTGHFFLNERFAETIDALPGRQFGDPPTYVNFPPVRSVATHPVLDRLSVRYFVTAPQRAVFGRAQVASGDGSTVRLRPGAPVTVPVRGPLRAVGVTPGAGFTAGPGIRVEAVLRDRSGSLVARTSRLLDEVDPGRPSWIPVTAEDAGRGERLTLRLTLHRTGDDRPGDGATTGGSGAQWAFAADGGVPAVSTVRPADDGLRLAYAGSTAVYERVRALPRIRWADRARIEPDRARRLALVGSGRLGPGEVVLDGPAGPPSVPGAGADTGQGAGQGAEVVVLRDGLDEIEVSVDARGAGHLVVADALQQDWVASVDGRPAQLVAADHGLVAVPVPRGRHTVRLTYQLPYGNAGGWVSGGTAVALLLLPGFAWWRGRRSDLPARPALPGGAGPGDPPTDSAGPGEHGADGAEHDHPRAESADDRGDPRALHTGSDDPREDDTRSGHPPEGQR